MKALSRKKKTIDVANDVALDFFIDEIVTPFVMTSGKISSKQTTGGKLSEKSN